MATDWKIVDLPDNDEAPHFRLDNFNGVVKWRYGAGSLTLVDPNRAEVVVDEGRLYLIVVGGWTHVKVWDEAEVFCLVTGFGHVEGEGRGWHVKTIDAPGDEPE